MVQSFILTLESDRFTQVIQKGSDPTVDSYSGFADNGGRIQTELDESLRNKGYRHPLHLWTGNRLLCQVHRFGCSHKRIHRVSNRRWLSRGKPAYSRLSKGDLRDGKGRCTPHRQC